jgi:peptidoglycan/LPS O-acetylase OafA/YrhL/CubicO group peptidase (beta-lactamase class C family)
LDGALIQAPEQTESYMQEQEARVQPLDTPPAASMHLNYLPGLNGLRALAVIAVLLYHADLGIYGGYLGVESFFALSGYLITTLLLLDIHNHGRVRLQAFWLRRARRLLPALFVLIASALAIAAVLLPKEFASLTRDGLAAIAYVTNWFLIASGRSYFDAAERPPLLQHLWSLAIEEQFYLVWPLLFAASMRFVRARGTLVLTLLLALGSAALMWSLYDPGADPSRIYYGTDTRAAGLLIGAALAFVWRPGQLPASTRRGAGIALDAIGLLALGGLLAAYALLHEQHPSLYRGGFQLVALGTAVIVAAAVHPQARLLPWLLELPPLRWIGVRSYGIYLWHWLIFMVTRPGVDVPGEDWQVQLLRFALTLALAGLSYTFVELPIRAGALGRFWNTLRRRPATPAATSAAVRPAPAAGLLGWLTGHSQRWYGRWAPAIATIVLMLGVAYVTANAAQAAVHGTLLRPESGQPALRQAATAPTASAPDSVAGAAPAARATPPADQAHSPAQSDQFAGATPTAPSEAQFDPELADQLQHILDDTVADSAIPGAALSVRMPDGTIWTGTSGLADLDKDVAMQPSTRVRIGSLSKMFTAVVVLQLMDEGKLSLDDPLTKWLPGLVPKGDSITVRQLLQHTSGLYDYLEDRRLVSQAYDHPERVWTPEELVKYAVGFPPSFAPGANGGWDYSSTNYVILGMIIERTTGRPLDQELRQRIFTPLGLRATYVVPAETVEGTQAHGYSKDDDRTEAAMSFTFGSANIVTSIDDLRTFGISLFAGDLLKDTTLKQMQQFVNGKGQYNMPALEYGLGLMGDQLPVAIADRSEAATRRVIGHIGGFGGFRAALWYAPEDGMLVALSVNQASTDPNKLASQVFSAMLAHQKQ